MQQYYLSTIYILLEYEYISLAIIRSVSLRLQNEGQKNSRIAHGVFDTDFFDLIFWCIGIINGFASVTACGCWENEETKFGGRRESQWRMRVKKKNFFSFFALTPSLSSWNALFIGGSVVRASVRVNFLPSHLPSHHNPSKIPFVPSGHNPNQKKIKR